MKSTTEQNVTVEQNGFKFHGRFVAHRLQFLFDIWEITHIESGRVFSTLKEIRAEFDADIDQKALTFDAGSLAGMDVWTLADMDCVSDND